jgi:hypothetical protein
VGVEQELAAVAVAVALVLGPCEQPLQPPQPP